jgi:Rad3-related DNA helicase
MCRSSTATNGKLTTRPSPTVEVVSKDDLAGESSSNKASPLPHAPLRDLESLSKADTQVFIQMSEVSTSKEMPKKLNQQLLQHDLDDTSAVKKLLDKHLERLRDAGNGTHEANGNASSRLSKSGTATKRCNDLLSFDNGKHKLIQKSLKTITAMASAHDACALKVRSTVTKLSSALQNLTDQIEAFKNDTAASAMSLDKPKGKGVLTSANDKLEKLLNKQCHLQTGLKVLLDHKPYEDELIDNIKLAKIYIADCQPRYPVTSGHIPMHRHVPA